MVFETVTKVVPTQRQAEHDLVARECKKPHEEMVISTTAPYFPGINTPLSLISENKWSVIGAVAGDMTRAHMPKLMVKMFRVHAETAKDYDELIAIVKRWVVTS